MVIYTYMFSLPVSCLFELPMLTLEKFIFPDPPPKKAKSQDPQMNQNLKNNDNVVSVNYTRVEE